MTMTIDDDNSPVAVQNCADNKILLSLKVGAKDAVSVYFWIVPETLGQTPIEVKAVSNIAGDAVRRQLLVKVLPHCV